MDMHSILTLCKSFTYEKFDAEEIIIRQKDPSNDKFYVLLSGEVAVIISNENLGKFGDIDKGKEEEEDTSILEGIELHKGKRFPRRKNLTILTNPEVKQVFALRNPKRSFTYKSDKRSTSEPKSASAKKVYNKSIFAQKAAKGLGNLNIQHMTPLMTPHASPRISPKVTPKTSPRGTSHFMLPGSNSEKTESLYQMRSEGTIESIVFTEDPKNETIEIKSEQEIPMRRQPRSSRKVLLEGGLKRIKKVMTTEPSSTSVISKTGSLNFFDTGSLWTEEEYEERIKTEDNKEEEEKSEFETLAESYGKIVRYLKEGEGFGEIALKRNIPRTASILCKTECEVLVMKKEQYELGFGRMQREKEEFLNSVFTMLTTNISSTQNYNYLLYSFKVRFSL